jgi:demethylmenaquinone methyltransferase/2-methoxy-6-polyprenyl-1,4-benzoquinol methylase
MRRVTRPGGLVAALEITRPGVPGWDAAFGLYFNRLVPLIGAAVARDRAAYTYLPRSVARFVTPFELAELMRRAGLRDVRFRRLGLGTIALHVGAA